MLESVKRAIEEKIKMDEEYRDVLLRRGDTEQARFYQKLINELKETLK